MNRRALLFPGQASQYVGMGKDLYDESAEVRVLYDLASRELGADICRISFEGPAEELKRTRFTQPAILLHSLAVLTLLKGRIPRFDYAAGHSLGEYVALAAVGALSFEDAIRAVVRRATLMEEACIENPGTMAATIGLSGEAVGDICNRASAEGVVIPANFNSSSQVVVSGSLAGVEAAVALARDAGARRAMMLEVGGAFHSPLMSSARDGLREFLKSVTINRPTQPVVANVTAQAVLDTEDIRRLLVEQITAPVRWAQTMSYLTDHGVTEIFEIGPGKVLSSLAKREMRPESIVNLDTLDDVNSYAGQLV
ncbi:MAG: ACP S-malonyltransferase [Candidatus Zixiibacteriota bacterium]|nr:MAG: ACP S-malonyltransferase [candidate division Zixibacteria bacterium]